MGTSLHENERLKKTGWRKAGSKDKIGKKFLPCKTEKVLTVVLSKDLRLV